MSIFPTRILFATDGSEDADAAARMAVELATSTGSELHVIHVGKIALVYHPERHGYVARYERLREHARQLLDEEVEKVENMGGAAQSHLAMGRPDEEIVVSAEGVGAGLIVVGSRGLGGIERALMGSVSDSVVRHAHCPVLVVRWKPVVFPARILLATDGSGEAELAARTVAELAETTGSELHVAHVGRLVTNGGSRGVEVGPLPTVPQEELDREARELLEVKVERLRAAGASVAQTHLRRGRADQQTARWGSRLPDPQSLYKTFCSAKGASLRNLL